MTDTASDLKTMLADPMWRLTSGCLYKIMIKGDDGEEDLAVPFIPNASQFKLLENMHHRNIILKARQLGFTTLIAIYFLDCVLFRDNVRASIVAQTEGVAKTIFRDKVQFAYNNFPATLRQVMPLARDSQTELLFAHNNSAISVATSARGGTLQYLHVSEFGKICAKFPDRANEVITGSIPSVTSNGVIFIESTAEGQEGAFYDMCRLAMQKEQSGNTLTQKEFKFNFFPWWVEPRYKMPSAGVVITATDNDYFDKIEQDQDCILSQEQRAWWCSTRDSDFSGQADRMWQEYPSTPEEAFQQSTEGCYYSAQMTALRKQGRITTLPHRPGYPVNTYWDIGSSDGTAIWLHQRVGQNDNFIGFIEGWGEPYAHYVSEMQKTGYVWGVHYLPHDAGHVRQGQLANVSPQQMLDRLGLKNIELVPRVDEINHGIQVTRDAFATVWFDETACKAGIIHLDRYRKRWSTTNGRFMDAPLHDEHSEGADAFRQFAQSKKGEKVQVKQINFKGWS